MLKRTMRYAALFLGLFVSMPLTVGAQLAGQWSGTVSQPGSKPPSYSTTMSLDRSGGGSIDYPDLQCGGTLTFIRQEGSTFVYRERIMKGRTKCIDGGTLRLTPRGSLLDWHWSGGGETATATLTGTAVPGPMRCVDCTAIFNRDDKACSASGGNLIEIANCQNRALKAYHKCQETCVP